MVYWLGDIYIYMFGVFFNLFLEVGGGSLDSCLWFRWHPGVLGAALGKHLADPGCVGGLPLCSRELVHILTAKF